MQLWGRIVGGLLGVPRVARLFRRLAADDRLLASGIPGYAVVTGLQPTGWRYSRRDPTVRFDPSEARRGVIDWCQPVQAPG